MNANFFFSTFLLSCLMLISCHHTSEKNSTEKESSLIAYVNPFIGTGGHGHTYPGATMPFGMMQLSPDTRLDGWDGCSGYHYTDTEIYGFSHTHLSGTGVSDYGDVLVMPTNKVVFNNGADGKEGYKSKFRHDREIAEPGFYKVHLDATNIDVELTVSERSGMHRYTFEAGSRQVVILDLEHRDEVLDSKLNVNSKRAVSGYRHSKAWAKDQRLYFDMLFSRPFTKVTLLNDAAEGKSVKAAFEFDASLGNTVELTIGISAVDEAGAQKNWQSEIGTSSFEDIKKQAQEVWEHQLGKIDIEAQDFDSKTNFYTALYHTMIAPNIYQDIDGRYRGMDAKVHQSKEHTHYTVFSLWDTYRAAHPLYTIIEQERTNDFIKTFIEKYKNGGIMPIWDLAANYTGCMIGYHAVPVIADAYLKGIRDYDVATAFEAMQHSATRDKLGLESYKSYGFIPVENESESVSKTLEYAYDDWTIAQMAKALGKKDAYKRFTERAQNYKNVYDPSTQFMRGKYRNSWFAPFDPYEVNFNYTEANSWQYSFYVPQDISGFIKLLGGKLALESQLDKLFTAADKTSGRHQLDITGLIGQYAHGNEPSHHMAYLYNFVNKPHKTQEKVRQILTELYTNEPAGISGNEDCGQMSAWYVLSSMGFYSVTPASNQYIIGAPLFKKATINLENGRVFTITAAAVSEVNKYIKSVKLNGKEHAFSYIEHDVLMRGGSLEFEMTDKPSTWGTSNDAIPVTEIKEHIIVAAPFIVSGDLAFKESTEVTLNTVDEDTKIMYTLDGEFKEYRMPFEIKDKSTLQMYAVRGDKKSATIATVFFKIDPNISITLKNEYANQYNGGGANALIDGVIGADDFRTGTWQGYSDTDLVATLDLGSMKNINSTNISFYEDQGAWIFLPTSVSCYLSSDNKRFTKISSEEIAAANPSEEVRIKNVAFDLRGKKARYVKIVAKKLGKLPAWHLGHKHNGSSWLFADEIEIK